MCLKRGYTTAQVLENKMRLTSVLIHMRNVARMF